MWTSPAPQARPQGSHPMPQGQPHGGYPYPQGPYPPMPYSRVGYPYPAASYAMHGQYSPRAYRPQMPPQQQQQQQGLQGPMPVAGKTLGPNSGGPPVLEPQTNVPNGYLGNSAYTASPISSAKDGDSSTLPPGSPASTSFHDDDNSMISSPSTPAMPPSTFAQHQGSTGVHKLLEMGNEPDRRPWTERYMHFMEERGKPLNNLPQVAKQPLDLFRLYVGVKERGGVLEVVKTKKWKEVSQYIHINASASAAYTLRRNYTKYLIEFEYHFDRDGADPRPVVQEIEAMTKKKSKAKDPVAQLAKGEESSHSGRSTPLTNGCAQPPEFYHQHQRAPNGPAGPAPPYQAPMSGPPHHHSGGPQFYPGYPPISHYGQPNGQAPYSMHHHPGPMPPAGPPTTWNHRPPNCGPPPEGTKAESGAQLCNSSHQLTKLEHMVTSHQASPRVPPPMGPQPKGHQQQVGRPQFGHMGPPLPHPPMAHHRPPVALDPKTVEGTEPKLKYRALVQKDVGPVDLWRVLMALRSGLLVEVTWALNVLNVLLADPSTRDYFSLPRLSGLFDALVDVWRRLLIDLHASDGLRQLEADAALPADSRCPSTAHVRTTVAPLPADRKRHSPARVFVAEDEEGTNCLRLRCRSALNAIRSLSFLPNNEQIIANHAGFLRVAAALLSRDADCSDLDADDLLVSLSNVCGFCQLEQLPESVCRPLLSTLLSRLTDDNWFGLACESLAKLCVRPGNIDLILATACGDQLQRTLEQLGAKLRQRDQVQRELALALLVYLLAHSDDAGVCELAAGCGQNPVRPVLDFLEQVESQAVHICQQLGPRALQENPDLLRQAPGVVSLDLLHRAALSLRCVAERGGRAAREIFAKEEDRLLMLCMSSVLQPALTDPLADCLRILSGARPAAD